MSNPGTSASPTTLSITGNSAIDSLILKGIGFAAAGLTAVILTWLNAHGFNDPNLNLMISGAVASVLAMIAVSVWGFIKSRLDQAHSVTAGMNLALAGQAILASTGGGRAMPIPVTVASAAEIVKNFGNVKVEVKDEPALTEKLNETQIIAPSGTLAPKP